MSTRVNLRGLVINEGRCVRSAGRPCTRRITTCPMAICVECVGCGLRPVWMEWQASSAQKEVAYGET